MRRNGHPDDTQIIGRHFGDDDPLVEQHMARCHVCAAREQALEACLGDDRKRIVRAADAYFTPTRLDTQRAAVLARLDAPRRARVLTFPATAEAAGPAARFTPTWHRWAAATAAAVMVTVAGAGWLVEESRRTPFRSTDTTVAQSRTTTGAWAEPDDAALAAIDVALARPGAAELRALDALTLQAGQAPDRR